MIIYIFFNQTISILHHCTAQNIADVCCNCDWSNLLSSCTTQSIPVICNMKRFHIQLSRELLLYNIVEFSRALLNFLWSSIYHVPAAGHAVLRTCLYTVSAAVWANLLPEENIRRLKHTLHWLYFTSLSQQDLSVVCDGSR